MPRIALLTLEDRTGYVIDDELAIIELRHRGFDASEVPWSHPAVDWASYDLVIVRTTWDYHVRPSEFLEVLRQIEATGTVLANSRELIIWNLDKRYLRELASRGVPIVPGIWGEGGSAAEFTALFARLDSDEIVIKPAVSANALDTFRLHAPLTDTQTTELVRTFASRAWLAQRFVQSVLDEGELSVFYFGGEMSHAVRKVPQSGDFRVQEEHGGSIASVPLTEEARRVCDRAIGAVTPTPFQARVDLVRLHDGSLALMELEMIEPSLYFRTDPHAPARFADAVEALLRHTRHAIADPR